jgi:hypothetical protein
MRDVSHYPTDIPPGSVPAHSWASTLSTAGRFGRRGSRSPAAPGAGAIVRSDQLLRSQLAPQMSEDVRHLDGMDGVWIWAEIEVAPGYPRRSREHLAIRLIVQHWNLPRGTEVRTR